MFWLWILLIVLSGVVVYDLCQRRYAILRNFPVIGHFRYIVESVGPEFRQYIVADNDEERPFSRDQRRWVYAASKRDNLYFGFGSDNEMERSSSYLIVKHQTFPLNAPDPAGVDCDPQHRIPCAKVLGESRGRKNVFRPQSVINISGMSFGSLSGPAVEALNESASIAGCLQNTGEGAVSQHHLCGGDLVWQIGTGYFGCRNETGNFSRARLKEAVERYPTVKAIEIKLSQGAKPGVGGFLPGRKITSEIAATRGIPLNRDCVSPGSHREFHDADSLLDFVEALADETGLPVGIKSAVGELAFWNDLADKMANTGRGVDFVAIDGGEGDTGAGPLVFTDHVALPFKVGFNRVYQIFTGQVFLRALSSSGQANSGFPKTLSSRSDLVVT